MAHWADFQSVIQLGAALNFGYATIEAITGKEFILVGQKHNDLIQSVSKDISNNKINRNDVLVFNDVNVLMNKIEFIQSNLLRCNPDIPISAGCIGLLMLVYSSFNAGSTITSLSEFIIITASYLCVSLEILAQIIVKRSAEKVSRLIPSVIKR